jgi:hypothetical protein
MTIIPVGVDIAKSVFHVHGTLNWFMLSVH